MGEKGGPTDLIQTRLLHLLCRYGTVYGRWSCVLVESDDHVCDHNDIGRDDSGDRRVCRIDVLNRCKVRSDRHKGYQKGEQEQLGEDVAVEEESCQPGSWAAMRGKAHLW